MDEARALLDSLMGSRRDSQEDTLDWSTDKSSCKMFLLGFCPPWLVRRDLYAFGVKKSKVRGLSGAVIYSKTPLYNVIEVFIEVLRPRISRCYRGLV